MPTVNFRGLEITYQDEAEFRTLVDEIWRKRTYYVDLATNTPYIVDAGAHIGLATLYFHSLYPRAQFLCIEPNPSNLKLLHVNLEANGVTNITIVPKALSNCEGKAQFFVNPQWTVFSSLLKSGWTGEERGGYIEVETATLSSLIDRHVDLLKMDIEGQESVVIREAQSKLHLVDHALIEFHQTRTHREDLIVKILKNNFREVSVTKDERKERKSTNRLLFIECAKKVGEIT